MSIVSQNGFRHESYSTLCSPLGLYTSSRNGYSVLCRSSASPQPGLGGLLPLHISTTLAAQIKTRLIRPKGNEMVAEHQDVAKVEALLSFGMGVSVEPSDDFSKSIRASASCPFWRYLPDFFLAVHEVSLYYHRPTLMKWC